MYIISSTPYKLISSYLINIVHCAIRNALHHLRLSYSIKLPIAFFSSNQWRIHMFLWERENDHRQMDFYSAISPAMFDEKLIQGLKHIFQLDGIFLRYNYLYLSNRPTVISCPFAWWKQTKGLKHKVVLVGRFSPFINYIFIIFEICFSWKTNPGAKKSIYLVLTCIYFTFYLLIAFWKHKCIYIRMYIYYIYIYIIIIVNAFI